MKAWNARHPSFWTVMPVACFLFASCGGDGGAKSSEEPVNQPPTAKCVATPASGVLPLVVEFDASASSDPDGSIAGYVWDFADGETAEGVVVQHTFVEPGLYQVKVTVTDNDGASASGVERIIASSEVAARAYSVVALPTLGGPYIEASDVNNLGQVVGSSTFDGSWTPHAFLYTDGASVDLGTLGGPNSYGLGVNDNGDVVGYSYTETNFSRGFVYQDGEMVELGTLGGYFSNAVGINNAGQVAGEAEDAEGFWVAFLFEQGEMKPIGDLGQGRSEATGISDAGHIVGNSPTVEGVMRAFVYEDGVMTEVPGGLPGTESWAAAVNASGSVVGRWVPDDAPDWWWWTGFIYEGGVIESIAQADSYPGDINNAGVVVGHGQLEEFRWGAFVWDRVNGYQDLNALIDAELGWTLVTAVGINDLGQIAVNGRRRGGAQAAFLLTPIWDEAQ